VWQRIPTPDYTPISEDELTNRMGSGIVENDRLIHKAQHLWSAHQTAPVPAAYIGIGYVVPALGNSKANPVYVEVRIAQRNEDEEGEVSRLLGLMDDCHCAMTGQCGLERETRAIRKQRS